MVFADLFFLFAFLPAFAICYLLASLAKGNRVKNGVLVAFSLLFYAWGEPVYVFLLIACALLNWLFGRWLDKAKKGRGLVLALGLVCNLAILGTFKYLGFFADLLGRFGLSVQVPELALPIGISFYTFQSISYLVDVYRKESKAQRRFGDLLLYISMFPQLIAGPIVRYGTIANEIHNRHVSWQDVADGSFRFIVGLGKKVILANQLSEVSDQFLAGDLASLTTAGAWSACWPSPCRFTSISPVTPTWRLESAGVWASISRRISTIRTAATPSRISGGAGIFPWEVSSGITSISPWAATGAISSSISWWCGS